MRGRISPGSEEVLQLRHAGEQLLIGISYRHLFYSVSGISARLEDGRFSGESVFDMLRREFTGVSDGVRVWGTVADVLTGSPLRQRDFELEPIDVPWLLADAAYRLYGSETADLSGAGYTPVVVGSPWTYAPTPYGALDEADWTFLGEATRSASFELDRAWPALLLTWGPRAPARFDSLVDEVAGTYLPERMRDDPSLSPSTYVNFAAYANSDPYGLVGPPDGRVFAGEPGLAGYLAITFPENTVPPALDPATGRGRIRVVLAP